MNLIFKDSSFDHLKVRVLLYYKIENKVNHGLKMMLSLLCKQRIKVTASNVRKKENKFHHT